jgi:hypothetical protein
MHAAIQKNLRLRLSTDLTSGSTNEIHDDLL